MTRTEQNRSNPDSVVHKFIRIAKQRLHRDIGRVKDVSVQKGPIKFCFGALSLATSGDRLTKHTSLFYCLILAGMTLLMHLNLYVFTAIDKFIAHIMDKNDDIPLTIENSSELLCLYKEFRHPHLDELCKQVKSIERTANLMGFGDLDLRIEQLEIAMEETNSLLEQSRIDHDGLQDATRQLNEAL